MEELKAQAQEDIRRLVVATYLEPKTRTQWPTPSQRSSSMQVMGRVLTVNFFSGLRTDQQPCHALVSEGETPALRLISVESPQAKRDSLRLCPLLPTYRSRWLVIRHICTQLAPSPDVSSSPTVERNSTVCPRRLKSGQGQGGVKPSTGRPTRDQQLSQLTRAGLKQDGW